MSADRLREAARVLRERADHAGEHPWTAVVRDNGMAWIDTPDEPHAMSMHGWPAAARYIATMHPGVGLALADWLDLVGAWRDEGLGLIHSYSNIGDAWADIERQAYRLADLILGAES